ncbi:hypothetical protein TNIN_98351 [Trichonephila inaurata madagascariensis]|uniref:Uncharacterized protein n=1 Tax=Trichonephila inaurata madagascariensis TaxID=2747483 RepID=A0A8X6Y552_9ARAC|nr:hypothetical protein TNIN_98351 [Trichonephila inaurata madagascariensis]
MHISSPAHRSFVIPIAEAVPVKFGAQSIALQCSAQVIPRVVVVAVDTIRRTETAEFDDNTGVKDRVQYHSVCILDL